MKIECGVGVRIVSVACALLSASAAADGDDDGGLRGVEAWGGIKAHPAVVHEICAEPSEYRMSLGGEWEMSPGWKYTPKRTPYWNIPRFPFAGEWNYYGTLRKITVPGCWESLGIGEEGDSEPWDCLWDSVTLRLRHKFRGDCWYRRTVRIPGSWKGRRIWLKVGGVGSQGWFWVNERQIAWVQNYCGTYKYEITPFVTPGEDAKFVCEISNVPPSRHGLHNFLNRWGGFLRDIELEATPQVCIDDAWVRGDFDKRLARVEVEIEGGGGQRSEDLSLRATVEGETVQMPLSTSTSSLHLEVPLRNFRPWSPAHPNLYTAKVELVEGGTVVQTRFERFGVRKLEVRGRDFYLNGRPLFLRGAGLHNINPIEGPDPADREFFRTRIAQIRRSGFNIVRLHTHCKWPEFFEMADELGLMVEPELPYYTDFPCEGFDFDPMRDILELWRNFRRHPSFCVYSCGNEGSFGPDLARRIYRMMKAKDPDRLVIEQDAINIFSRWLNTPETSDFLGGSKNVIPSGSFDPGRPFVHHEYLNQCIKLDSRLEPKFTGLWMPGPLRENRRAWLEKQGLDMGTGDRLQDAQHELQKIWHKYGIEAARADPFCRGYSFWSLQDCAVPQKGTFTAQGLFDPFWGVKPHGQTPEGFAAFNSPSCVLLDTEGGAWPVGADTRPWAERRQYHMYVAETNRVFASGDTIPVRFLFAHYGEADLRDAKLGWRFVTPDGRTLISNAIPVGDQPLGAVREVATARIAVPSLSRPTKATLIVTITSQTPQTSQTFSNSWDFWFFPKREIRPARGVYVAPQLAAVAKRYSGLAASVDAASTVVAPADSEAAKEAIAKGKSLVTLAGFDGPPDIRLGWWWMGTQMGMVLEDDPMLAGLPHEGYLSKLLFRIVRKGTELPSLGGTVARKDMVVLGEGGDCCMLYLWKGKRADGARHVSVSGLDLVSDTPEGNAILDGILDYLADCNP